MRNKDWIANKEFWERIRKRAEKWREEKLLEKFDDAEEPTGIYETIDCFILGKQNKFQKQISNYKLRKDLNTTNF